MQKKAKAKQNRKSSNLKNCSTTFMLILAPRSMLLNLCLLSSPANLNPLLKMHSQKSALPYSSWDNFIDHLCLNECVWGENTKIVAPSTGQPKRNYGKRFIIERMETNLLIMNTLESSLKSFNDFVLFNMNILMQQRFLSFIQPPLPPPTTTPAPATTANLVPAPPPTPQNSPPPIPQPLSAKG